MRYSVKGFLYQTIIDPILSRLHSSVIDNIDPSDKVLDIACGTGALSLAIAGKAKHVTGIDLSPEMIITAQRTAHRKGADNTLFELRNATDLSCYADNAFEVAVTSMAVHQFDAALAVKILAEMNRIASKVIIVDYNHHIPKGLPRSTAWGMEFLAGGEHYRNFRVFMQRGGVHYFAREAGMKIASERVRGSGVFVVVRCESVT